MKTRCFGGNSGYVGYSMSVRAMYARNNGEFPKTDFCREYGIAPSHFKIMLAAGVIEKAGWHHTSKFGNKTEFYSWCDDCSETFEEKYAENKSSITSFLRNYNRIKKEADGLFGMYISAPFPTAGRLYFKKYENACSLSQKTYTEAIDAIRKMFE